MAIKKITDAYLKSLQHKDKSYKVKDDQVAGLFLLVHPNGSKYWRMNYTLNGKRTTYAVGVYSTGKLKKLSITKARDLAREVWKLISEDKDPVQHRQQSKNKDKKNSFKNIAKQWHDLTASKKNWKPNHADDVWRSLENNVFEYIGDTPIHTITSPQLLAMLRRIESRGALEILKKVRQRINGVFIYAKVSGLIESNPAEGLETVLNSPKSENHPHIEIDELPKLIKDIKSQSLTPTAKAGLLVALYTFLRSGEIRFAKWAEIDFDKALWTLSAKRMKMNRDHIVPLPKQLIEALKELHQYTGHYPFVFASNHKPTKQPVSEHHFLSALHRMGYKGKMSTHGFRHIGSTILHSLNYESLIIEAQLSHKDTNKIRETYNKSNYLDQRVKMMQFYADFVDNLDADKVVPIKSKA